MMPDPQFPNRIDALVARAGGMKPLARRFGVSDMAIKAWRDGSPPLASKLREAAARSGIALEWLRDGEGEAESELAKVDRNFVPEAAPRSALRAALAARHLTAGQLARMIGYDAGVIENLLNGTGRASERMLEAIVQALPELSKEELMGGSETPLVLNEDGAHATYGAKPAMTLPAGMKGRNVPLLSMAQAGAWDANHDDGGYQGEAVFALNVDDRRAFAIKVMGNSMEPEIREGDVVVCSPGVALTNGACAVVRTHSDQAFIKFWRRAGDEVVLESANPAYKPIHFPVSEIAQAWPVIQRIASGMIRKE